MNGLASLRRMVTAPPVPERCEICAGAIGDDHEHLIDPRNRRLLCACRACGILFDHAAAANYRRVPRDIQRLADLPGGDAFWNSLAIPTGLVFLLESSVTGHVLALYPSPAGPTEADVDASAWSELKAVCPELQGLRQDVEALLAKRTGGAHEYYVVPIDECYKLTGLIRRHWRGFSGGDDAWQAIQTFFAGLSQRARHA